LLYFRDIATVTLYVSNVTTYDLDKFFSLDKKLKLQATFAVQCMCKTYLIWELERFQTVKVTSRSFKVIGVGAIY